MTFKNILRRFSRSKPPKKSRRRSYPFQRQLKVHIGHVLNEQGTGYEYLISTELRNRAHHLKEHPNIRKFTKFESYWLKGKGMVRFPKSLK